MKAWAGEMPLVGLTVPRARLAFPLPFFRLVYGSYLPDGRKEIVKPAEFRTKQEISEDNDKSTERRGEDAALEEALRGAMPTIRQRDAGDPTTP